MQTEDLITGFEDLQRFTVGVEESPHIWRQSEQESTQDESEYERVKVDNFEQVQNHCIVLHCDEVRHDRSQKTRDPISD